MDKVITIKNTNGTAVVNIIDGSGNSVNNTLTEFSKGFVLETGLSILTKNYFDEHVDCSQNFNRWVDYGTPLSLVSVYQDKEYRREKLLQEIKERLGRYNQILLLGTAGVSKSILVSETICDLIKTNDKTIVICNLNQNTEIIKNIEHIEDIIIGFLNGGSEILIAVDDCHATKASNIFLLIRKLEEFSQERRNKIKFILAAREPDFTNSIDGLIYKSVEIIESMESLRKTKVYTKEISEFTPSEVREFIIKYNDLLPKIHKEKPIEKFGQEIYERTHGYPIMVKFFVLNKGLESHVRKMYLEYIMDSNNRIITSRFELIILNALYDISAIPFTEQLLTYLGYNEARVALDNSLLRKENNLWKTIHPMWDIFLFKYLFSLAPMVFIEVEKRIRDVLTKFIDCDRIDRQEKIQLLYTIYNTLVDYQVVKLEVVDSIISSETIFNKIGTDNLTLLQTLVHVVGRAYARSPNISNIRKSITFFDRAIKIDSGFTSSYDLKGIALTRVGKIKEAIDVFDLSLSLNPRNHSTYINKGIALSELFNLKLIECFDEALKINHDSWNAYYHKGLVLEAQGRHREALENYEEALKRNPYDFQAYNNKGNILRQMEKYQESIDCYDRAIEINPTHSNAYYNRGVAYEYINKSKAIENYDKVLELNPSDIVARFKKGNVLIFLERYQEAVEAFEKILEIDKNNEAAIYAKAIAKERLDRLKNG